LAARSVVQRLRKGEERRAPKGKEEKAQHNNGGGKGCFLTPWKKGKNTILPLRRGAKKEKGFRIPDM